MAKSAARWRSYRWLLLNTVTWGAAFILVKPALAVTTPLRFLWYRYLIAGALSIPILWHYRHLLAREWRQILPRVMSLECLGTVAALALLYLGLERTSAIEASLIVTTQPLFITLGGLMLLKEHQERHEWWGLLIAMIGAVVLVVGPGVGQSHQGISLLGNGLVVTGLVVNMIYFPLAKKLYNGWPKFLVTAISFYLGMLGFGLLSWLTTDSTSLWQAVLQDWQHPSVWLASGYMATAGSIIGLTAYIKGQDGIEASEASLFWYLQPLVSLPLGWLWLHETITPMQLLGLGIVLLGVWWAERRLPRLRQHRKRLTHR